MKSPFLPGLVLGLALAGASASAQTQDGAGRTATEAPVAGFTIDTVVVDVDGTKLTVGDLLAIRRELPTEYQQLPDEVLFNALLEQMTDQILLARAAEAAGLDRKPAVALRILNQDRAILADAYLRREVEKKITPEAVEALYMERYVNAGPVEERRAAHILVDSKEKAEEIKAKIDAGADFAAMAKEFGTDATAQNGGELGWFTRADLVPAFADAVFAMEPGTVSEPVETDFGWHLIKLEEVRERPRPPFEKVEAELTGELVQKAQAEVLERLRAEARIEQPEVLPPAASIRADALLDAAE